MAGDIALLAVAAAAAVAAAPALRCRFVGGDDLRLLLKHPLVSRPCWANALQLLTRPHYDLYQPLPMLAYMAEYRLYGRAPLGYHVDRLILHTANALLAWWLVWQLTRRLSTSTLTGLAFAVHPLAVEAVASVAKLTIGLSTALVLACMIAYLRWRQRGGARRYGLSLLTGLLALLCKPIVTLPLGLWLLEAYRARFDRRRLSWRHLAGGLPLLITAVVAGWLNLQITSRAGLTGQARQERAGPIAARAALVDGWALVRYVWPA
ncbi:MAG: hypothetical protein ACE5K7_08630, partial [Phycisphaerae bacterium]